MSYSLVTSSVNPTAFPTTFTVATSHPSNETSGQAINIGDLDEESAIVNVSDQGAVAGSAVSSTFQATAGDVSNLTETFANTVDESATHFQLYDSAGNLIADNQGTTAQQEAYTQWFDGTLQLNTDTYTAIATPAFSDSALSLTTVAQQGTSLGVNSQLTGGDTSEYYNFTLNGGNIKLAFDAGSASPSTRVQLLNSDGNVVADSQGNAYEQANYIALTSGTGLTASSGDFTVKVSYTAGADTTQNINYNLQLFSGTNYAVVYNNNVTAQAANYTAAGSVTQETNALAFQRQAFNKIAGSATNAVNIGWLFENKSTLGVQSQLTSADSADYYSFTFQNGDNLKFGFSSNETPDAADLRVQLLDSSGLGVIADSQGTPAQQAAYKSLTTTNGLKSVPGNYLVKITYANGAPKTTNNYTFNLYSGTSYSAQYQTIASAQTYGNAILSGTLPGATAAAGIAAYLTGLSSGTQQDIIGALSATV